MTLTEGEVQLDFEQGDIVFLPQREASSSHGTRRRTADGSTSRIHTEHSQPTSASNDSLGVRRTAWTPFPNDGRAFSLVYTTG